MNVRPAAVPLVTVDPYFSIWSCNDYLHDDTTRNWTEKPNPIMVGINVCDKFYSMGATSDDFVQAGHKMRQTGLEVRPLSTIYKFENEFAEVILTFVTPLLIDRPKIFSRPVSYVEYEIKRKCEEDKKIEFVFGINSRCCVGNAQADVTFRQTEFSLCCGNIIQKPLSETGDMVGINWGYLHLCDKDAFAAICDNEEGPFCCHIKKVSVDETYNAYSDMPYITVMKSEMSGVITLAYDEIKTMEYFGETKQEYFNRFIPDFDLMISAAKEEYWEIKKHCDEFDDKLLNEAANFGENYGAIISLAYRQAVAAHKLGCDDKNDLIFLSKECESNGCMGTIDLTYPSMPLFLKYNPELVEAMLRPIVKYAKSKEWQYNFVPHDVGRYPIANGQWYGKNDDSEKQLSSQMPIEETGNMLLCLAAVKKYLESTPRLFEENAELMKAWADYLVKYGYDPGMQLCTDDFAGQSSHNCNLSLKAILGIASYSYLSGDNTYMKKAEEYARKWEKEAKAQHGATRLSFDKADSWSIKYNMVWDSLLGFHIFSDDVKKAEIKLYKSKMNRYGVPLDSRADYTKLDWLMWSTRLTEDKEYFLKVTECIVNMINETADRVPLTDWYYSSTAAHIAFQNRSVVGGVFISLI